MRTAVLVGLLVLTALRLATIGQVELSPDEAYYYQWSQRLDWAYYSKGPGVALAIRAGTGWFGATEFGVRFLSPLLALGTSLLIFGLARRLYDSTAAAWAVLLINATPIFAAGALLMTIDPLSIFFWSAGLVCFWHAIDRSPRFSLAWPAAGLCTGLGFLCKYTNAIFVLSVVLFLAVSRRHRKDLVRSGFGSFLLCFSICTIPPILWNADRGWVTASHLLSRGKLDRAFSIHPGEWFQFLGMHFGVYSPLIFAGIVAALAVGIARCWTSRRERFLILFALPLLVLYFVLSLQEAGEANWTAPAMVSAGILAAGLWAPVAARSRGARGFGIAALVMGVAIGVLALNSDRLRNLGVPWPHHKDPSTRLKGWRAVAQAVDRVRSTFEERTGTRVFLIANKYQTAASLAFYLPHPRIEQPGHPPVYIPESQDIQNQYSFWGRYDEFAPATAATPVATTGPGAAFTEQQGVNHFTGRNALFITDREDQGLAQSVRNGFARTELIAHLEVHRAGLPMRTLRIYACYDYRTQDL